MRLIHLLTVAVLVNLCMVAPAAAQEPRDAAATARTLLLSDAVVARAVADEERRAIARQQNRDSLKNGVIIGAVVGGVAGALFGKLLCEAFDDANSPCWDGVLRVGALGAGIGAGAGAGIDAMLARQTPLPLIRVRF